MGLCKRQRAFAILQAVLLLAALLLVGACSGKAEKTKENNPPKGKTEISEKTTSSPAGPETTGDSRPPEVTLGHGGESEAVIRLEGDPGTTFSGLCSLGSGQKVLVGQVPKRFQFALKGRHLSCRIEKRDDKKGDLKVVLIAGETTRSVQQTNTPGGVINVSYKG